jgi:general secretion pathway protein D
MLVLVLAIAASGVMAQDVSDKDRLTQGIELYNAQKYPEALEKLQGVNKANLPEYDQNSLETYLTKTREGLAAAKTAAPAVAEAKSGDSLKPVVTASDASKVGEPPVVVPTAEVKPAEKPAEVVSEKPAEVKAADKPAETPAAAAVATPVAETPKIDLAALEQQAKKARAAAAVTEAEAAVAAGDTPNARMLYARALSLDPENAVAKAGLDKIDAMSGHGTRSLMVREGDRMTVEAQRLQANVTATITRAQTLQATAMKPEDFDAALGELKSAYRMIDQSSVLTPEKAEELREAVKAQWDLITKAKEDMVAAQQVAAKTEIDKQEAARLAADRDARKRQIASLWSQSEQLVSRYQYKEAVKVLDQLLIVAPDHDKARRYRQDYSYLAGLAEQVGVRDTRKAEQRQALVESEEASIPYNELYRYKSPKEWAELTVKRRKFVTGASGESEIVQATRRKLHTKGVIDGHDWSLTLALTGTGMGSVLDFIAEAARAKPREITINIDRAGIAAANSTLLESPIDLQVKDVSIDQALQMVLGSELGYVVQDDGSVLISSRARLSENLPVTAYFVGDLITQVPDFGSTVPRMNTDITAPATGGGGGGGGGANNIFNNATTEETEENGAERLRALIERTIRSSTTEPWESAGGRATLDFYERSGLMLVSQTPDGHQRLQALLENLRREWAIMINVETRCVTVTDSFLNDVTLDFDVTVNQMGKHWPGAFTIGNTTAPGPIDPATGDAVVQGTGSLLPGLSINGDFATGAWSNVDAGMTIAGTFLDDIQVGFLIRAIQADRRSTTVFAPRVTLWNGQRAWVSDGTQSAYVSDLEPIVAEAAVSFDPTISYMTAGSILDVKATASADRRYVQLDLRPQIALPPDLSRTTTIEAGALVVASAEIVLPTVRMTHLMTSVSVPDGGTLLIGGLKSFEEHDVESGVPVLNKLPVLKRIFSNRAQVRGQSNMLLLVKPTIIIQAEKEEELGVDDLLGGGM